jgi:hypothetical protein
MIRSFKTALSGYVPIAMALATALAMPAAAQSLGEQAVTAHGLPGAPKPGKGGQEQQQIAPPALPGAAPQTDQAVPSNRPTAELSPNDALFDAIDRGDLADARDAMGRGADLNARNVLGLTPIDLAVDLSRNDITFLLLSLRGAAGSGGGPKHAVAAAGGTKPMTKTEKKLLTANPARPPAATLVVARTADVRPQPLSSNPGTPAPQVGFLGFGAVPQQ